ncbi:hypothetical protein B0G80_4416 [Paraburkholderia sp. BL6669N2]|uniref:helix-turn-helix domain-containing protein n=1 Tax=Paraburkholderia sp. BL6669N2 TaxID=1938807 RepID=UPI000E24734A|nr:helix-turn-helix transcriptional regulator [Paraburkholderia sp. BL6669N2]REG61563.1 hypothetical protein B0G80_4416 [Paraburkholderia sp. BL6669N2]
MKTIEEIRADNFEAQRLVYVAKYKDLFPDRPEYGTRQHFGAKLGLSPAYVSHIKTGKKAIGSSTARDFETRLGLERGWFDNVHDVTDGPA